MAVVIIVIDRCQSSSHSLKVVQQQLSRLMLGAGDSGTTRSHDYVWSISCIHRFIYLLPHSHASRSSRHAHTLQHATYQCRTNYFKYSYFPHTIVLWNALPQAVVSSPTLVAFKTSFRRGRMPQNCNLDSGGDIVITL